MLLLVKEPMELVAGERNYLKRCSCGRLLFYFSLAKNPKFFQTESQGYATFGERTHGARPRQKIKVLLWTGLKSEPNLTDGRHAVHMMSKGQSVRDSSRDLAKNKICFSIHYPNFRDILWDKSTENKGHHN